MEVSLQEVHRITADWRAAPPIHVVRSYEHLPVPSPPDADALYTGDAVYLVGDHPPDRVAQLLGHEVHCHHGLRLLHGPRAWTGFMGAVAAGARGGDLTLQRCREHVRNAYRDADGELYLGTLLEADETAARLAELLFDPELGPFVAAHPHRDRLAALLGHIQRDVLLFDEPATAGQVRGALLEAAALIRDGRRFWNWAGWCYPAPTMPIPKPMGPAQPARDLAESEWLLQQEASRRRFWEDGKGALVAWGGILSLIVLIACIVGAVFGFLEILSRPFR